MGFKRFNLFNYTLLVVFLKCTILCYAASQKSHPITTLINAKWIQTPLYLEISEYLADENSNLFWDFIENIVNLDTPLNQIETESKSYLVSINAAKSLIGSMQTSILKLAVSMHSLTPRVQLHFQLANETFKSDECKESSTFLSLSTGILCDIESLNKITIDKNFNANNNEDDSENSLDDFSFDHIYPGSENNSYPIILYSDIGSTEFKKFHSILKEKAINGDIKYILRHYVKNLSNRKVRLSGYGVELHLKSTEYKSQDDSQKQADEISATPTDDVEMEVEGFDFQILKSRFSELSHSLDRFRNDLVQKSEEMAPLKAWEFQDLGLQAVQRISEISGEESLQILQFTAQNFPTQAKSLLTQTVSEDLRKEMKHNTEIFGRSLNLQPPDGALFINGLYFDVETLDLGLLLETLRTELTVISGLYNNDIKGKLATSLLALDLSSSSGKEFAIDIRDTAVLWANDIENDPQYRRWPSSVMDLLRPTFPGMLRSVRKNLFNLVLVVDPIAIETRSLIKLAESFIIHLAPIRLGFVFDIRNKNEKTEADYRAIFCAFNYISQKQNSRAALGFLTDVYASVSKQKNVKYDDIRSEFKKVHSKLRNDEINEILGEDSEFNYGQKLAIEFIERLGFKSSPQALLNGVPLPQNIVNADDLEEAIFTEIIQQTPSIQKSVYRGDLTDSESIIDFLMNQPHVMPRLNQRILYGEDEKQLDMTGTAHHLENVNSLMKLSNRDMIATVFENIKYFVSKNSGEKFADNKVFFMTIWVVTDLEKSSGRLLLKNALKHMKSSGRVRIAFIPNTESKKTNDLNRLVWAASQVYPDNHTSVDMILKWLKVKEVSDDEIPEQIKDLLSNTDLQIKILRMFSQRIFNTKESESVVINNGRVIGPLLEDEIFTIDDFNLMERYNNLQYTDKLKNVLNLHKDTEGNITSDTIFKLITTLLSRQQTKSRFSIPTDVQENHTVLKLSPKDNNLPFFDITAVLDPASKPAQKLAPILILLRNVINCNMKVFLCAVEQHSDMPVKNFYRFVVEPEVQFTPDGKLSSGPYAKFTGLPASPLLTQNLQVPENWLVEVVRSVYDLDNIKLIDIGGPVHSEYELEYLLLEGHCFDTMTGAPPRGLQITLGTRENPTMVDTIVMANLGYFQLKANPGVWELRLRQGRSSDIYDITSAEGLHTIHHGNTTRVVISSLRSHVIKLRVTKKPDKLNVDLLSDDDANESGIWNSIASSFSSSSNSKEPEILNIFSLASGHLYERLLRIMMLSVLKHTKTPVKFWFLKNYLSPSFTDFLPHMAEEYGFQYELVQYKWPRWLHQQTEKQRTIWGYKILFLDVLFPLDVKKIIFVDADAIVRSDLLELNNLDLNGAPYAYTPFCDSRKEMEGFRFWKQGYWRNHLMGRKYHISALYVVDLKKFRKIAAGDRLRGQYQALSQDPNSLSNLDQDLPNNMIHQVPIKSLPEEWLWCETWCSNESLKKAKVIDLCNNPMTKEAKLTAAQRIVPEWKKYDNEIKNLMSKVEEHEMDQDQLITSSEDESNEIEHTEL